MATINVIPDRKIKRDIVANTGRISGGVTTANIETISADVMVIDADTLTTTTINATNTPEEIIELNINSNPTLIPTPGNYVLTAGGETNVDVYSATVGDIIKITTEDATTTFTITANHYNNADPPVTSISFTIQRGNVAHLQYDGTNWVPLNANFSSI